MTLLIFSLIRGLWNAIFPYRALYVNPMFNPMEEEGVTFGMLSTIVEAIIAIVIIGLNHGS